MDYQAEISEIVDFTPSGFIGYSEMEIQHIESFYGIKVVGGLRDFLLQMGRSSGNVDFNSSLIPYIEYYADKTPANIRKHLVQQYEFLEHTLMKYARPFYSLSPILFVIENKYRYGFLRTCADEPMIVTTPEDDYSRLVDDPEIIYFFDDHTKQVDVTSLSVSDYILSQVSFNPREKYGRGEMIVI